MTALERILRRDTLIILSGMVLLIALAWVYILTGAGTGMSPISMTSWQFPPPAPAVPERGPWGVGYWFVMLAMWWVMMIGMMTSSAVPMLLLHARAARFAQDRGTMPAGPVLTGTFAGGYLLVWLAFSAAATVLQWALEAAGFVDGMMMWSTSKGLSGGILLAAGLYQLSPFKAVCLRHCRAPADYLSAHWRPGRAGALRMGIVHGAYCLGCCWMLMLLLFTGGIMNLLWIAGLAIVVLAEKVLPGGQIVSLMLGVLLIGGGAALLYS